MIGRVDEFVLLDDVQYTRRDWRNRNLIKTPSGLKWLTVPVQTRGKYHQTIRDTMVDGNDWPRQHWRTLCHAYARAPHFPAYQDAIRQLYDMAMALSHLSDVNLLFLKTICSLLDITTPLRRSDDFDARADKNLRLLDICRQSGATHYLSGPSAASYLDKPRFDDAGIDVTYMDYDSYIEYPQLHPPFEGRVSILDLLFNTGAAARRYLAGS